MTPNRPDPAQIASNGAALLLTIALAAVLFAARLDSWHESLPRTPGASQPDIEVSLEQAAPEAPPAPVPPTPARKVPERRMLPRQTAPAETPAPAKPQSMPLEPDPVPEGGALLAATGAAPSAQSDARPDLEAQYAAGLRADIDRRTHPPDSAQYRLRRPSGEVRVGFVVRRDGEPKTVRVVRSSGSSILDQAAIAVVASGRYPPMPAKVFAGEAEHSFVVTIEFRAAT